MRFRLLAVSLNSARFGNLFKFGQLTHPKPYPHSVLTTSTRRPKQLHMEGLSLTSEVCLPHISRDLKNCSPPPDPNFAGHIVKKKPSGPLSPDP